MPDAVLAPGARIECRSAEWLVRSLGLPVNSANTQGFLAELRELIAVDDSLVVHFLET